MKLIRFGQPNQERPGVELNDHRLDVSAFGEDYDENFFATQGVDRLREWFEKNKTQCPMVDKDIRWASPVRRPSKIVCVGLNYEKHAMESKLPIPKEPVLFFKASSSLCGPFDNVIIPKGSTKTDWEVELALIISKTASYVPLEKAHEHIAGYVVHNDYSEREFQIERGGQWVKGKSCDTFAPLGPYLVTTEEVVNPQKLNLWLKVNGETLQNSNTEDMIFKIPFLVHYISQFMTLLPGDVVSTGTPFGVGLGFDPPRYLKAGDVVELGVEGLGVSKQHLVAYNQ